MQTRVQPKYLLIGSLCGIAFVFIVSAWLAYEQFKHDFVKNEFDNQKKMTRIVNQSLDRYFETLKYVVENSVLHPAFSIERSEHENDLRFKTVAASKVSRLLNSNEIAQYLTGPRTAKKFDDRSVTDLKYWQIFKALPDRDEKGKVVAEDRRTIARNILKAFPDIHYAFEMDSNGDLVFLEPFNIQKNITSFNYDFRDYLKLAKDSRKTVVSEGYISHDRERTQIITVATPIFDRNNQVSKVFAVSVSATTLRERVFRSLKEHMDLQDGTTFYLVDRHGHIVASSSGQNIYFPKDGINHDNDDRGNLRNTGFFKEVEWSPDVLEKGNIWERQTRSWQMGSLKKDFSGVYSNLNGAEVFATFFPTSIIGSNALNWGILIETPTSQLLISESHLKKVFYTAGFVLFFIIFALSVLLLRSFRSFEGQILAKQKEVAAIASQVAHDIRSPLAALSIVAEKSSNMPESERLLVRSATNRIQDIANNLISKNKAALTAIQSAPGASGPMTAKQQLESAAVAKRELVSKQLLSGLIDVVITEKRIQHRSKIGVCIEARFDSSSYGMFANIQPSEFKIVMSNILNNAIEAIPASGKVLVTLLAVDNEIVVEVKDTGTGVSPDIMSRLTERGATFGKANGNGLGLHHAKTNVENWGGRLEIESSLGKGTSVRVRLPRQQAPKWFVPELTFEQGGSVVILDDDNSIHQIWKERFAFLGEGQQSLKILHFSTVGEAKRWFQSDAASLLPSTRFLFDYELIGQSQSGLDLIEELGLRSRAVLVTSHSEEKDLVSRCERLGVGLIPKVMAGFVPIVVSAEMAS